MLSPIPANEPGLRRFVGADLPSPKCCFVLPHFKGGVSLENSNMFPQQLSYGGFTFAERDSRAAFYVHSLVAPVFNAENIAIEPATSGRQVTPTAFLFGSRSNILTQELLQGSGQNLFRFEFGDSWKIWCNGIEFAMPDPSQVTDSAQYANMTDFGVVARFQALGEGRVFVIAGLGGRATEGSARFFVKNWSQLATKFGEDDFAEILQFDPPFQVERSRVVATARSTPSS